MNWVPFYFDGNQAWGLVDSPAEWERIKTAYREFAKRGACASPEELLDATNCPYTRPDMPPMFGFVVECLDGTKTLREFFAEHGMEVGGL